MYNSTELTFDKELTTLSYQTKINAEFKINEIQSSDLWETEAINDNIIKAIPLFNCEQIISSNPDDIILEENKCIIIQIDEDTIIKCVSDDRPEIHFYHMQIYSWIPYTTTDPTGEIVYSILADEYMNPMVNAEVEVVRNGEVEDILITDNNGQFEYVVPENTESLSFRYNMDRQYWII